MTADAPAEVPAAPTLLDRAGVSALLAAVRADGYELIGPTVRDGAIVYDTIEMVDDLPVGWTDTQAPGSYRLREREDQALFGYVVGPHTWKQFVFPPRQELVSIRLPGATDAASEAAPGFTTAVAHSSGKRAFLGVRACEVAALGVQDRVFLGGDLTEPRYRGHRRDTLIIAVNCLEPGDLCFCASMDSGPRVGPGYDLCLTELDDTRVLLEVGSERGGQLAAQLTADVAPTAALDERDRRLRDAESRMGRALDTDGLGDLLFANLDHARWRAMEDRCLSCGNCTSVCPTCFCFSVADQSELDGVAHSREMTWDSCFSQDHSTIHGSEFRPRIRHRYRQWLTHKLASWNAQFSTSGCTGCGRCIAWCPVGIDITEEVSAIRADGRPSTTALPGPAALCDTPAAPALSAEDPLRPWPATVVASRRESGDVVTLHVRVPDGYRHHPGQFNMLSLPGIGDVPISISGRYDDVIEHTIRAVGAVTDQLCRVRAGATIGLRGPFGRGWPMDKARGRAVVVIAGGIGMAPLREAVRACVDHPREHESVSLFYGARVPEDVLYAAELLGWQDHPHVTAQVTVDRAPPTWRGHVGVVTKLLDRAELPPDGLYFTCGPEIMMHYVVQSLERAGIGHDQIFVTMERNMKCAAGFCGRCQYGPYFICKDGPVFRYDRVAFLFGKPGF